MDVEVELLISELRSNDHLVSQQARRKLVKMGSRAVERLVRELSSSRQWVRWEAAKALGQIADTSSIDALVTALEDREFDVRWLAAEALINIGQNSIIPLLEAVLDHGDTSVFLRHGAHHVLHDMPRGKLNAILEPVMKSLEDTESPEIALVEAGKAIDSIKEMDTE